MSTATQLQSEVTVRELPPEEFELLRKMPPFSDVGLPPVGGARAVVAQTADGTVVGFWFLFNAIHVEPFYLDMAYRRHPGVLRRMWRGVQGIMESLGASVAWAVIPDVDIPAGTPSMAQRMGFHPVAGKLYFIHVGEQGTPATTAVQRSVEGGNGKAGDGFVPPPESES
jgi:hypothetical protein